MAKYQCRDCKQICTEDELDVRDEGCSENFWGTSVWVPCNRAYCPNCGSEFIDRYYPELDRGKFYRMKRKGKVNA